MNLNFDFSNIKFDYNSTVIITYLLISIGAWLLNILTRGKSNKLLFESYRSSPLNPMTYIRMFTHAIGHRDWDHLVGNFLYILLIGPMIEEKYGSINLTVMFLITSLVIALFNIIFLFNIIQHKIFIFRVKYINTTSKSISNYIFINIVTYPCTD